jgi:hypothetical protein
VVFLVYRPQSLPFAETKQEFPQSHSTMQKVQMSNFWDANLLNNLLVARSSHPHANSRQLGGFCDQARLAQIEFTLELTQQFITDAPLIAELNGSIAFHAQQFA